MLPPSSPTSTASPPEHARFPDQESGGPLAPPRRLSKRGRRWLLASVVGGLLFLSLSIGAAFVTVPYYAYSPGRLFDTKGVISVEGADQYPADGSISFATVSLRGPLTLWGFGWAFVEPNSTIVEQRRVLGDADPDEGRQRNLQLMDVSTQTSSYVALERLGYEVELTGTGAMVVGIESGFPAERVLEIGDTIVSVDGVPISLTQDLIATVSDQPPGTRVELGVTPLGSTEVEQRLLSLAAREDDPTRGFLGIRAQTRDLAFDFPFSIRFLTAGVGGPSAGLAFSLTLLDQLTPGDLTGGLDVAVTGTLDLAGNVGPIGGLEHKAVAARRAGVDLFIVPAASRDEDLEAARRRVGDRVQIVPVWTLDEALEAMVEAGGDPLPAR
jgi:Lon-like protease